MSRGRLECFAAIVLLSVLSGCAGGTTNIQPAPSSRGLQPITLNNCGHNVALSTPPKRILTIKSSATEAVLALGAADRLIGTAASDGPVPAGIAPSEPPVISREVPSSETVLGLAPDLIYAGWESNLTGKTAGDRGQLAALGIATYVSPAACQDRRYRPAQLTFDDVFFEIDQVGQLIGESSNAEALIERQRTELARVPPAGLGRTALWYSSGTTTPYVGAGSGAPEMIMSKVGLRNVAADINDSWAPLSWEVIAARRPDLIILVDASWNTAEAKIELLKSNPSTAALAAVKNNRFLFLDFAATQPGVRNVAAATQLSLQLSRLPA